MKTASSESEDRDDEHVSREDNGPSPLPESDVSSGRFFNTAYFLLVIVAGVLSYVDRQMLALLVAEVRKDFYFSAAQYGYVVGVFSVAYSLSNPIWGYLIDRLGVRRSLGAAVAIWSAASALHSTINGITYLAVLRFFLGLAQGVTFPPAIRSATSVFPIQSRGRSVALAYAGGPLGAFVAPLVTAPLALAHGWRVAFTATGLAGLLWLGAWWFVGNKALIVEPEQNRKKSAGLMRIPRDKHSWGCAMTYALGGFPLAFVLNDGPLYLHLKHHIALSTMAQWFWLPPLGWGIGFIFWGWAYDTLSARGLSPASACRMLLLTAAFLGLPLVLVPWVSNVPTAVALMGLALFASPGFVTPTLAWATSTLPIGQTAFLTGLSAGLWSAVVALLMPILGHLFDIGRPGIAFVVTALLMPAALSVWLAIARNSKKSL